MSLNKSIEKIASRLECFVTFLKESGPFVGENPSKMATKQKFGKFSMKCLNQFPGFVLKVIFYGFYHGKSPLNWIKLIKTTIWENIFGTCSKHRTSKSNVFFPWKYNPSTSLGKLHPDFSLPSRPLWVVECKGILPLKCRNTWGSGSKYQALLRDHDELHSPEK